MADGIGDFADRSRHCGSCHYSGDLSGYSICARLAARIQRIFEAKHGFQVRGSRSLFLHLIGGVLGVLVGLMVVTHPVAGALA
ncbi:MAG TPA: hypothetical protein VFE61_11400, partial [Candidatus Sulfotelmatobacter sp.]|nr:hypothetical protein [Candidatus Sulfotelmatobacter sp.]